MGSHIQSPVVLQLTSFHNDRSGTNTPSCMSFTWRRAFNSSITLSFRESKPHSLEFRIQRFCLQPLVIYQTSRIRLWPSSILPLIWSHCNSSTQIFLRGRQDICVMVRRRLWLSHQWITRCSWSNRHRCLEHKERLAPASYMRTKLARV